MTTSLVLFSTFFLLLFFSIPIAFALIISSALAMITMDMGTLTPIFTRMFASADSWLLLAIPFFVLAGYIMEKGGVTERLINFANSLVGFLPGGLSATNVVASMFFGGVSGSAVADTSANGTILIPAMVKQGYSAKYSAAITAASSPIGIIIPPSIPMILWGFTAGLSVAELFMAGIGAGILVGSSLIVVSTVISVKRGYKSSSKFSLKEVWKTGRDGFLALMAPIVIIGGIITGFVTPTEAAVIAALYSLLLGFFVFKELKLKHMPEIIINTGKMTGIVMLVIVAAAAFSHILTINDIPSTLANFVVEVSPSSTILLLGLVLLFIILGMFLDANAAIILTVPIIAPVIVAAGLDPVHTSVILITTLGVGLLTPPVGLCTYVAASVAKLKFEDILGEIMPFLLILLFCIGLLIIFPQITTTIPVLLN